MRIDVLFGVQHLTPQDVQGRVVAVIDVLRASTTIAVALAKMRLALETFIIEGPMTTIPFLARVMQNPRFQSGDVDTKFLEREPDLMKEPS